MRDGGYSEGTGDRTKGKELFVARCGSCHTLADAGTSGKIGPNLDYAFLESRRDGLGESTIQQVVRGQIAYPITDTSTGAPGMPENIVKGQDAEDVASYVASCRRGRRPERDQAPADHDHGARRRRPRRAAVRRETEPRGKQVFETAGCGGCHTLADAGSWQRWARTSTRPGPTPRS